MKFALLAAALLASPAVAADWPAWRGPSGDGVCSESDLPEKWSPTEGIAWKINLPDRGNSTPVISGGRVFLTQAIKATGERLLLCLDRRDGSELWRRGTEWKEQELSHDTNPFCSASPVTDGERIIAWFGSAGLFCWDRDGKELWRIDLGKQEHIWGWGASPVLQGDLCFLNFGPGPRQFLVAVNKLTGKEVWRHTEPGGDSGQPAPGGKPVWTGSWSDPLPRRHEGQEVLYMTFPGRVCAFDGLTGRELWTCAGLNPLVYASPLAADGVVTAMGGYSGMALAVRTGGSGEITASHRLWQHPKTRQRIGSGVIRDGLVFMLTDPGIAECFELRSGRMLWEERIHGPGSNGQNWSSLVLCGDQCWAVNKSGDSVAFRASGKFEQMHTNCLGEACDSSMAPSGGQWFIRTHQRLWCIGKPKP